MRLKMKYIHPQLGTPLMLKSISIAGQYPVVRTRTVRSTPPKDTYTKQKQSPKIN
jgi:hypothetical protein